MKERKSYTDMMKSNAITWNQATDAKMKDLYIDMVLNEISLTNQKNFLLKKIDEALDLKDKDAFIQLTLELSVVGAKFGY
jgi:uncharacterized protein YpiB (UPF0302 family)